MQSELSGCSRVVHVVYYIKTSIVKKYYGPIFLSELCYHIVKIYLKAILANVYAHTLRPVWLYSSTGFQPQRGCSLAGLGACPGALQGGHPAPVSTFEVLRPSFEGLKL